MSTETDKTVKTAAYIFIAGAIAFAAYLAINIGIKSINEVL